MLVYIFVTLGLKNDNRKSLLDIALDNVYKSDDCVDISLYLLHQGCGDRDEIIEVFCEACRCGKLKVVNELIDNYQVDPNSKLSVFVAYLR